MIQPIFYNANFITAFDLLVLILFFLFTMGPLTILGLPHDVRASQYRVTSRFVASYHTLRQVHTWNRHAAVLPLLKRVRVNADSTTQSQNKTAFIGMLESKGRLAVAATPC